MRDASPPRTHGEAPRFPPLRRPRADEFERADYEAARIERLEGVIERLTARVLELEARVGAAGTAPTKIDSEAWYSPREVGGFLGWSRQTVYTKIRVGVLPAKLLPGSHRQLVQGADVLALLARMRPACG